MREDLYAFFNAAIYARLVSFYLSSPTPCIWDSHGYAPIPYSPPSLAKKCWNREHLTRPPVFEEIQTAIADVGTPPCNNLRN